MKWSKFNHLCKSRKYGHFLYNSATNSFVRIDESVCNQLEQIKDWNSAWPELDEQTRNVLSSHRIIVDDDHDERYLAKKRFLKDVLAFNNSLTSLTVATTTGCNFRCPYCYEQGTEPLYMDRKTEEAILEYVLKFKNIHITWYGGEPLMNFDSIRRISDQIAEAKNVTADYEIITNGYYLDAAKCHYFSKLNLKQIQITIDGTEKIHEKTRITKDGTPTYRRIMNNIDVASKLLPQTQFAIRVNIGLQNKDDYPLLVAEFRQRWPDRKNIKPYLSFVDDYGSCKSACLSAPERIEFIRELRQKYGIRESIYPIGSHGVCVANRVCDYVVSPNGDLYKCWADIGKKDKKVGTIFTPETPTNFDLITDYALAYDRFADPKCLACFLFPVCDGGCPESRYARQQGDKKRMVCPFRLEYIDDVLEMIYEDYLTIKNSHQSLSL